MRKEMYVIQCGKSDVRTHSKELTKFPRVSI